MTTIRVLTQTEVERAVRKRFSREARRRHYGTRVTDRRARGLWENEVRYEVTAAMIEYAWAVLLADPRVAEWRRAVTAFHAKEAMTDEDYETGERLIREVADALQTAAREFRSAQPLSLQAGGVNIKGLDRFAAGEWLRSGEVPDPQEAARPGTRLP